MLAIGSLFGGCGDVGNIRTGVGLGNGNADALLSRNNLGDDALLQLLAAKLEDGRQAIGNAHSQGAGRTGKTGAHHLSDGKVTR